MENKYGRFTFIPLSSKSSHLAVENEMMIDYDEGELYIRKNSTNILIASSKVSTHIYDTDNPHKVTKEQVGLGNVVDVVPVPYTKFETHIYDTNNPHKVTKEQIGLGNVKDYGIASVDDIVEGRSDRYVTPKIFLDYLDEYGLSIGDGDDEHTPPPIKEGTISFIITPADAIVSVNISGEWKRGYTHTLPYGVYQYKIEKQGYTSKTGAITLDMNMIVIRETIFEVKPVSGRLTIVSIPPNALTQIEINGKWVTGNSADLPYGRYKYKISLDGYETMEGIAIVDRAIVSVTHTLKEIKDPGTPPDPTEPPITEEPDPGQVGKNEIYITNHNQFSDITIERVNGSTVNMELIKREGILTGYKPNELYRVTLTPSNIRYKIVFLYINTNTVGKFIEVELEEEDIAHLTFKVSESSINKVAGYTIKIKSKISSIGEDNIRYINQTIQASVSDIKEVSIPKSLYDINIEVTLLTGHKFTMKSARTEYLQDIDFLITINDYKRVELKNYPQSGKSIGIFTDIPLGRFTTMTVPKRPEAIIETKDSKKYIYVPNDSVLYIMISEPGQMPRISTLNNINDNTVVDINNI